MHLPRVNASRINTAFESLFEPQKKNSPTLARHPHAHDTTGNPRNILRLCMGTRGTSAIISLCGCVLLFLFRYDKDPNFQDYNKKDSTRNNKKLRNRLKFLKDTEKPVHKNSSPGPYLRLSWPSHTNPYNTPFLGSSCGSKPAPENRFRSGNPKLSLSETQNFPKHSVTIMRNN